MAKMKPSKTRAIKRVAFDWYARVKPGATRIDRRRTNAWLGGGMPGIALERLRSGVFGRMTASENAHEAAAVL